MCFLRWCCFPRKYTSFAKDFSNFGWQSPVWLENPTAEPEHTRKNSVHSKMLKMFIDYKKTWHVRHGWYFWWKKSGDHHLGCINLVSNRINYPSTVSWRTRGVPHFRHPLPELSKETSPVETRLWMIPDSGCTCWQWDSWCWNDVCFFNPWNHIKTISVWWLKQKTPPASPKTMPP